MYYTRSMFAGRVQFITDAVSYTTQRVFARSRQHFGGGFDLGQRNNLMYLQVSGTSRLSNLISTVPGSARLVLYGCKNITLGILFKSGTPYKYTYYATNSNDTLTASRYINSLYSSVCDMTLTSDKPFFFPRLLQLPFPSITPQGTGGCTLAAWVKHAAGGHSLM